MEKELWFVWHDYTWDERHHDMVGVVDDELSAMRFCASLNTKSYIDDSTYYYTKEDVNHRYDKAPKRDSKLVSLFVFDKLEEDEDEEDYYGRRIFSTTVDGENINFVCGIQGRIMYERDVQSWLVDNRGYGWPKYVKKHPHIVFPVVDHVSVEDAWEVIKKTLEV